MPININIRKNKTITLPMQEIQDKMTWKFVQDG